MSTINELKAKRGELLAEAAERQRVRQERLRDLESLRIFVMNEDRNIEELRKEAEMITQIISVFDRD